MVRMTGSLLYKVRPIFGTAKRAPTAILQALADGPSPAYGSNGLRIWPADRHCGFSVTVMVPRSGDSPVILISIRLVKTSASAQSCAVGSERTTRTHPLNSTVNSPD